MRKVIIIGGGGVRTPLVLYGLAEAQSRLGIGEVILYDVDEERAETMARLGREVIRKFGQHFEIKTSSDLEAAAEGADFVLNSIRVGGIAGRAKDERLSIDNGLAGQETTGPGGAAMALRTVPVALAYARMIENVAPHAWFINFTNPAGLITQALIQNTKLRIIGICDTPIELFHRIADAVGKPYSEMEFDYAGLNHLGWVRRVRAEGIDITDRILADEKALRTLYPAGMFDTELIQTLRMIPTEYLFFYYSQRRAYQNQVKAGASRGEELKRLNDGLFGELAKQDDSQALETYSDYLVQRNASYMRLEAQAGSAFNMAREKYDPFAMATGYHRIALDVMKALTSEKSEEVVVNVTNNGAIIDLEDEDVVEVPCDIDVRGPRPRRTGRLPESVRGLVLSVKAYERTTIKAALSGSAALAKLAMLEYPIIGQWDIAQQVLGELTASDPANLGYLR